MKASGALLALMGCLVFWVPLVGAAPVNDDFANREDLGTGLPVEVERSSFGATKEAGEPDLGGSGHSVWFAWEAAAAGFVTVDTCKGGIGFRPEIAVFTGTALGGLTEVAGSFATEDPDCGPGSWGTAVTFRAIAGFVYAIGVDGVASFSGPEQGQGLIDLRLDATPLPANDDFADATPLSGQTLSNGIYSAGANGFTWNATKEPGEPAHAGDPGGASVWYEWTAPSTDLYSLAACGRFATLVAIYAGGSLSSLAPVATIDCASTGMTSFQATTGTTYRIAVDGKLDGLTGATAMGSVSVHLIRSPAEIKYPSYGPLLEAPFRLRRNPINTMLRKRKIDSGHRRATFRFGSNNKEARFRCQLDKRMPTWCRSPKTYEHLSVGLHTFKVYAVDPTSSGDGTPPIARFRIARMR